MQSQELNAQNVEAAQENLGHRITQIAEQLGGKRALAERTGLSEGQIYRYIKGENSPTSDALLRIADAVGASLDWLVKGKSGQLASEEASVRVKFASTSDDNFIRLQGSAAIGFNPEWLARRFHSNPEYLLLVEIEFDEGMKPTLGVGDLAIVDTSKREARNGVYYFHLEGYGNTIKRLQFLDSKTVRVISDDFAYETISTSIEKLAVVGQVVWLAGKYP